MFEKKIIHKVLDQTMTMNILIRIDPLHLGSLRVIEGRWETFRGRLGLLGLLGDIWGSLGSLGVVGAHRGSGALHGALGTGFRLK